MKINRLIMMLAAFVLTFTTFSYAQGQTITERVNRAFARIDKSIQSGDLTRQEADKLWNELNKVRDDEARLKADGRLTKNERARLERELDRLEKHISTFKRNDQRRDGDGYRDNRGGSDGRINERVNLAFEKIKRGIESGYLTRQEADRLWNELNKVRDDEARLKADGRLTKNERARLEIELDRLEKHISTFKHNDQRRDGDGYRDNRGGSSISSDGRINERVIRAHERIDRAIQSGALTSEEGQRLKDEFNKIRDEEARMVADGSFTRNEKARLEKELDRLERHISTLKNNVNGRGRRDGNERRDRR